MIYGSVCSGIEAATVAWHGLGWQPAWFSEIEPFPCKVLAHHYPNTPNLGNMLHLTDNPIFNNGSIDLLVGGTPCQSFSVAGLRNGLSDDRGNLALEFCRLLIAKKPRWFVWENVPGVFSSYSDSSKQNDEETSDFAAILAAFRECGYCCAWRVLDAQFCGVPQRRRRVFVVGYFGNDWRPPATVLFERESLLGNFTPGRKKRQEIAGTIAIRTAQTGSNGRGINPDGTVYTLDSSTQAILAFGGNNTSGPINTATAVNASGSRRYDFESETFICYPYNQITSPCNRSNPQPGDSAPTLGRRDCAHLLIPTVRRLTPLECERLQGFPDNYTLIPGACDTNRYQAIGNSMAVPVMRWIGNRIDIVDKYIKSKQ